MVTATSSAVAVDTHAEADEDVIRQVLDGDSGMFELLMRRYNERVYRAARAIVRDEQEAEDVMQQAYVNAFTHLRQFNGAARFSTWLTRIAINESLARVRRRGRYEPFDDDLSNVEPLMFQNPEENPERQAFTAELRGLLEWAVDRLPDGMREVFMLREVEGLSTAEPPSRSRFSRATWTEQGALATTAPATEPSIMRRNRPYPCEPSTIRSAFHVRASSTITSFGLPSRIRVVTVTSGAARAICFPAPSRSVEVWRRCSSICSASTAGSPNATSIITAVGE